MNCERRCLLIAIFLFVPLGFLVKFGMKGPMESWGNRYGAAILYEIFWILVLRFIFPKMRPSTCGLSVFIVTSFLEVLQLWKPVWLQSIRRTFLGAAVLGDTFDVKDFLYYAIGSYLGYLLLRVIVRRNLFSFKTFSF